ncbi:bifunctional 5,10-methylenetetrahydrofolate dehydrogenase/5,10-methenyltetrahydrofolate cyclohydrolase [Halobacteriovorax sp. HLS]|uniref:bifunctional 5,10-methylenetetrahydrofolate dehydrogenase/5,10-methenyltetrahydrofolate cyclohydrolase n=1 Tax=Halobacteriovorax sp. HLS TaxID=2234000 RepID=UPI000FD89E50|nr:bifunctional 5,10-methylenetetrahydrofolate dehydrogenase/5,10-methenyltetrahydrofolate cyclohydrolase [Halobacteriovorax sp. HLS]
MNKNETIIMKSKPLIKESVENLKNRCSALKQEGIIPTMKVILVGDNPASLLYTRNKKKFIENLGAECEIIKLPSDLKEDDFLDHVADIVSDPSVHGCFVQLPLPKHLAHINVGELIPPYKDVDGFNKFNVMNLYQGEKGEGALIPCTPKGIVTICNYYGIEIENKNITIVGRSLIVGKPLSLLLTNHNATVSLCHSKTQNLKDHTKQADIIIMAIGSAKFLTRDYLSDSKSQAIIDVGMNQDAEGKLCGDTDFHNIKDHVSAITPVPGGIGPMTILSLAQNLLQAAEKSL